MYTLRNLPQEKKTLTIGIYWGRKIDIRDYSIPSTMESHELIKNEWEREIDWLIDWLITGEISAMWSKSSRF